MSIIIKLFKILQNLKLLIMKYQIITIILFIIFSCTNEENYENKFVYISGKVTDFENNPIEKVKVAIKNKDFKDIYQTETNNKGNYSIKVKKSKYFALYAIKESDYGKTKLEYWAWNIPAFNNLEINPQYNNLEIYGVHIFEPKIKPNDTYRIYLRPMSLKKFKQMDNTKDTINILPILKKDEIKIEINNKNVEIKTLDRILEFNTTNKYIYAYELQVLKPKINTKKFFDKITIKINSLETQEKGKSDYFFIKKDLYNQMIINKL